MTDAWTFWPAPAKLNLFLHIVGRRDDGYHLLQTVFQLLDFGDRIGLRVRTDGLISRDRDLPTVPMDEDLCIRAAHLLRERCQIRLGVDIAVEKHIPIGGGMGGGSSDAASVLVVLNRLWKTNLSQDELAMLGASLGADVPVFVRGDSAWAEGIGDQLTPIALPARYYAILAPSVGVATGPLFQAPELTRDSPHMTITGFLSGEDSTNVFAPVARARYPQIAAAMNWLDQFGAARLSGTGACVFVAVESEQLAQAIVRRCPAEFLAFSARGVDRSSLHLALERFEQDAAARPEF